MSNGASSPLGGSSDGDVDMDTDTLVNGHDDEATPRPEPINENAPVNIMPLLARHQSNSERHDVCIVGAGPAGLMLGLVLARFGIRPLILDERADQTPVGRADGLQPKTIETLRMLGLADTLLQQSVKIYDITMWQSMSSSHEPELRRVGREVHYPAFIVDLVDPFVLIGHQGMVEKAFASDLAKRGISVRRCHKLDSVSVKDDGTMEVSSAFNVTRDLRSFDTTYLVGCDGAHSRVRKLIVGPSDPGARDDPDEMSVWGVLDGDVETNFPDIWTKCVVFSEQYGSVLIIPRERDMTRLYIEMRPDSDISANSNPARVQAAIMRRAAQILLPYRIRWKSVEWFGQYRVSQRVAPKFSSAVPMPPGSGRQQTPTPATINEAIDIDTDGEQRIFIAGDAAHTHSPKAAQGMNTALHDSWNLAWKLNLAIRGLAKPSVLLDSYSWERQKIARDLVAFDFTHAQEMSRGNPAALADNFRKNVRFISGVGCEYAPNALNREPEGFDDEKGAEEGSTGAGAGHQKLGARPGCTLPPGKVSRYIDANPVDVQLDIPVLGQFRLYFFIPDILSAPAAAFLVSLCGAIAEPESLIHRLSAAAGKSYLERPRVPSHEDIFKRPERYIAVSQLFAFALITSTSKHLFEISDLPAILSRSPWTIYLDDMPDLDTRGLTCTEKYLGAPLQDGEVAIVNVRPDGYVGAVRRWDMTPGGVADDAVETGREAARWLDAYFDGFLQVPDA
ncbi:hypothetical protein N8I77_009383 [Diaporthe amygdali]|uniref:Uncharacterized protein n=1 Tax=Phomopsis amygdali TaxID=1214568 RepID=A0AAD9SAV9_PHOAM|nr:hypothetical protein N8I77_009383 [Diaporthe amygdali]